MRPTKYKPEMCDKVIELGKKGMSQCEIACELGVAYSTYDLWKNDSEKPEFLEAVKEAVRLSQAWWEKMGREATFGGVKGFNATSYIFNMKNRFKDDWRDKHELGVTNKDGDDILEKDRAAFEKMGVDLNTLLSKGKDA